jgi:hypothetical protein
MKQIIVRKTDSSDVDALSVRIQKSFQENLRKAG